MEGEEEGGSNGSLETQDDSDDSEDDTSSLTDVLPSDINMASPSNNFHMLLSPSTSLASPSPLLPSPASLASPLTPADLKEGGYLPQQMMLPRPPVGNNPRDLNNPLSVNQLTGQCLAEEPLQSMVRVTWRTGNQNSFFSMYGYGDLASRKQKFIYFYVWLGRFGEQGIKIDIHNISTTLRMSLGYPNVSW